MKIIGFTLLIGGLLTCLVMYGAVFAITIGCILTGYFLCSTVKTW